MSITAPVLRVLDLYMLRAIVYTLAATLALGVAFLMVREVALCSNVASKYLYDQGMLFSSVRPGKPPSELYRSLVALRQELSEERLKAIVREGRCWVKLSSPQSRFCCLFQFVETREIYISVPYVVCEGWSSCMAGLSQ